MPFLGSGQSVIRQELEVRGKKIRVIVLWNEYPPATYNHDFLELLDYQKKKLADVDIDLKFHKAKDFTQMPYPQFVALVEKVLLQIVKQALTDYPQAITQHKGVFEIQIKIIRNENFEWYSFHEDSLASPNHIYLQFNGLWLINNIGIPYTINNSKKINFNLIYKFFMHTLANYVDKIHKKFRDEDYARSKHERIVDVNENHALFYLYLTFENLRVEGLAEFREKATMSSVQIHPDWIRNFRNNVQQLIRHSEEEAAEAFYDEHFGAAAYQGGAYYCGRIMCYIIGLAILKKIPGEIRHIDKDNQEYFLKKDRTKGYSILLSDRHVLPITDIEKAMNSAQTFYASPLPADIFKMAYDLISVSKYRQFIRLYEKACDYLGIHEKNRIVTYAFFDRMKKESTGWYEKRRNARAKEKGYAETESETEEDIDEEPSPKTVSGSHRSEPHVDIEHEAHESHGHSRQHDHEAEHNQHNDHAGSHTQHQDHVHTQHRPEQRGRTAAAHAHEAHAAAHPETKEEKEHASTSDPASGMMITGAIVAAIIAAIILLGYLGR